MTIDPAGAENLIVAITSRAAHDLRYRMNSWKNKPNRDELFERDECVRYFRSPLFKAFSETDPEYILQQLKREQWGTDE